MRSRTQLLTPGGDDVSPGGPTATDGRPLPGVWQDRRGQNDPATGGGLVTTDMKTSTLDRRSRIRGSPVASFSRPLASPMGPTSQRPKSEGRAKPRELSSRSYGRATEAASVTVAPYSAGRAPPFRPFLQRRRLSSLLVPASTPDPGLLLPRLQEEEEVNETTVEGFC